MIIVTGTKRSGTSMWMQVLRAAGYTVVGEAFPGRWGESIRERNPRGFYESRFRQGIFYATNPDPRTGRFVRPDAVEDHVVKVFVPGLLRSDWAFIGPVVATMRPWREYTASLQQLYATEARWRDATDDLGERDSASERRVREGVLPPALEWWFENYELVRDVSVRGYAFHMTTYDRLLRDPEGEIGGALEWLGGGDVERAVAAVEPGLRTVTAPAIEDPRIDGETADVFDRLYAAVDGGDGLTADFVAELNATHRRLVDRWDAERKARLDALGDRPGL